eukprot:Skav232418  [mRNA]  locus=scaffold189:28457:30469:+ [translate_table: standard]
MHHKVHLCRSWVLGKGRSGGSASELGDGPSALQVSHIRTLAKQNHDKALPELQKRIVKNLGFKDNDLWMTLAWIREMAPIIVHLDLSKMLKFMEADTHYRNQQPGLARLLKPATREKWERDLFGGCYDGAKAFPGPVTCALQQGHDRCKYGVLNAMNDHRGVVKCAQYGDSYLVLKDVRLRCTFSPEDSANLKAERGGLKTDGHEPFESLSQEGLAVLDFYGHV